MIPIVLIKSPEISVGGRKWKGSFRFCPSGIFGYVLVLSKDSGDLGRNSNVKVRFGFFRREYSGSSFEVVHGPFSPRASRASSCILLAPLINPPVLQAIPFWTNWFFALIREFRKGIKRIK